MEHCIILKEILPLMIMIVIYTNEQIQVLIFCKNWAFEDNSFDDVWVHAKASSEK